MYVCGKSDYTVVKAYHPISLLSFLFNMMEKLVGEAYKGSFPALTTTHL
jgi:hypothetical protein